jgi:hypothetical protein
MELCARSIKSQEGSRLWLRRTRTLCKFNCGKERCAGALRLCGKARQSTPGARAEGAAQECSWEKVCGRWRKTFVMRQGTAAGSTAKRTKDSSSSKWFHAAAVTAGGERSWISVAVNLSTTTIGPPHWGQRQRPLESWVHKASCSAGGFCVTPSN